MRIHPDRPDLFLFDETDLAEDPPLPQLAPHAEPVARVIRWAREYLSVPHPELGRAGPVCPYVPSSLRSALFLVAVAPGAPRGPAEVADTVLLHRDWFHQIEPRDGREAQLKTILMLFPDMPVIDAPTLIDATQEMLKPAFVADGLMIGQFHQAPPDQGGLWNPDFRPLRSPVPLLAIRHMVASDLPFLAGDRRFVASYLTQFRGTLPTRYRTEAATLASAFGLGAA